MTDETLKRYLEDSAWNRGHEAAVKEAFEDGFWAGWSANDTGNDSYLAMQLEESFAEWLKEKDLP